MVPPRSTRITENSRRRDSGVGVWTTNVEPGRYSRSSPQIWEKPSYLVVALPGPSIDAVTKEGTRKGCPYGFTRTTRKMGEVLDGAGMDFTSSPDYIAHSCV